MRYCIQKWYTFKLVPCRRAVARCRRLPSSASGRDHVKGEETRLGVRFSPPLNPSHPLAQLKRAKAFNVGTFGSGITR